jgi:glycosyltransferase involved in cell wall biosynthesis
MAFIEKSVFPGNSLRFLAELWAGVRQVRRIAGCWGADLIFTNSSASLVGILAARLARRPHVAFIREMWTQPQFVVRPLYWCLYHWSVELMTVSDAVRQATIGHYDLRKAHVVYDGLEDSWFAPLVGPAQLRTQLGLGPTQMLVGTVARLSPQKGIHCFVEAAARIHRRYPDVAFLVVGDIPRPRYQAYKEQLLTFVGKERLGNHIHFLGWRADVKEVMALFAVNVLASVGPEGAGRVIPEGWAVGVPAVVCNHSGPAELVQDGVNGLHFRTGDAADLADKVMRLLSDAQMRVAMQSAGRERALRLFGGAAHAQRVEHVWERAVTCQLASGRKK